MNSKRFFGVKLKTSAIFLSLLLLSTTLSSNLVSECKKHGNVSFKNNPIILPKGDIVKNNKLGRYRFRFLTNDSTVIDAYPVFSYNGKDVVFARQPNNGNIDAHSKLCIVSTSGDTNARVLFEGVSPHTHQLFNSTRPDYSWTRSNHEIAFDAVGEGIWLLDVRTKKVKQILKPVINGESYAWSSPAWFPDGQHLSVTNHNNYGELLYHELVKVKVTKKDKFEPLTNNKDVWAGESSIRQTGDNVIAFAGQVPVRQPPSPCTCNGGCNPDGYGANCNQIWVQRKLQPDPIDNAQGRAPWLSPDGQRIVFESNRDNSGNLDFYKLFIYSFKDRSVQIITPPSLNVQHAKWSPDGKKIVFAVQLGSGGQGIALVELE